MAQVAPPLVRWRQLALALWGAVCLLGGGALLAFHLLPLPVPAIDDPLLRKALADNVGPEERGRWRLVHVMYARCPCSQKILDHLVRDPRPPDVAERVVIVDAGPTLRARLSSAGFVVDDVSAESLKARWHVEAAPMLIVADPDGEVRYAGGYTDRKQGPVSHDVDVLDRLRRGDRLAALPLFGCATSRELQRDIDPFGLKAFIDRLKLDSERREETQP